jgi:hypothetical protein
MLIAPKIFFLGSKSLFCLRKMLPGFVRLSQLELQVLSVRIPIEYCPARLVPCFHAHLWLVEFTILVVWFCENMGYTIPINTPDTREVSLDKP